MKTNLLILLILLCIGAKNYAQNVNIPDANFKAALVGNTAINTNGDSEIQVSEASAYIGAISVNGLGIYDLTGIEAFIELQSLFCGNNQLTTLNISNNVNLVSLNCGDNQLISLDIANNINLKTLFCKNNQLTSLDLSNNNNIETVYCFSNQLNSLIIANHSTLKHLYCYDNLLTNLDLSNNTALVIAECHDNQLVNLIVSNNTALISLLCENNQLNSLDVSGNTMLGSLHCENNQLSNLDVSNNLVLQVLICRNNPSLSCIQVWDTVYANNQWKEVNGDIDPQMFFRLDCSNVSTAENLASSLSILPNPASDYLYISYKGEKKLSFVISDIWGKNLTAWEAHSAGAFYQKEVPIADFPVGIYFLSVQAGDKKVVKKFVKE